MKLACSYRVTGKSGPESTFALGYWGNSNSIWQVFYIQRWISIWSFNRPGTIRYTTVTKDSFVGIGAGASPRIGDYFSLNIFSVADYIKAVEKGSSQALATKLNTGDNMLGSRQV